MTLKATLRKWGYLFTQKRRERKNCLHMFESQLMEKGKVFSRLRELSGSYRELLKGRFHSFIILCHPCTRYREIFYL